MCAMRAVNTLVPVLRVVAVGVAALACAAARPLPPPPLGEMCGEWRATAEIETMPPLASLRGAWLYVFTE
jgi:hypothetical protein